MQQQLCSVHLGFMFCRAWAILAYMSDFCGEHVRTCSMPCDAPNAMGALVSDVRNLDIGFAIGGRRSVPPMGR